MPRRPIATLALVLSVSLLAGAQQPGAWRISDQPGANAAQVTRLLTTVSMDTYTAADGSPKPATLQVKCSPNASATATLSIDSGDAFAVKTDATVTLSVRLDSDPEIRAGWANLSRHQILIYDLRDLLPTRHRMAVDLPVGAASPQRITFDLSGLAAAMRAANCRRLLH